MLSIDKIKKIHFIGIGGIGVSAIARMMIGLGKEVTGSDVCQSEITQDLEGLGARVFIGHKKGNISKDIDLVVYSVAVPDDNPERIRTSELYIQEMSYGRFLGEFSMNKKTIAVTGTNGKTTTSAILGKVLIDCGLDPTVIIGSQLKQFNGNFYQGKSEYLVIEADEYKANMLKIEPWTILLTSIEEDHLDYYRDINDIIEHFQRFIDKQPINGFIFYNADDQNIKKIKFTHHAFSCSLREKADYWVKDIKVGYGKYQFPVYFRNNYLGEFTLRIPGEYNILNSLMVIGTCHQLMIDLKKVKESLANFGGLWRRFEVLGNLKEADNITVVSDYTHHPAAIQKTLKAAKDFYPKKRLFLVYQPHQHDRTRKLFDQFVTSFNLADFVILNEIYDVVGRKYGSDNYVSSKDMVKEIIKRDIKDDREIIYSKNLKKTKKLIKKYMQSGDLLLIMGAGDIDRLAREIMNQIILKR